MICIMQSRLNALGNAHHFCESLWVGGGQIGNVSIRNDHDVAGGVWIAIEDYERFGASEDDLSLNIIIGSNCGAENTACVFRRVSNVTVPPRRPQIIHSA